MEVKLNRRKKFFCVRIFFKFPPIFFLNFSWLNSFASYELIKSNLFRILRLYPYFLNLIIFLLLSLISYNLIIIINLTIFYERWPFIFIKLWRFQEANKLYLSSIKITLTRSPQNFLKIYDIRSQSQVVKSTDSNLESIW